MRYLSEPVSRISIPMASRDEFVSGRADEIEIIGPKKFLCAAGANNNAFDWRNCTNTRHTESERGRSDANGIWIEIMERKDDTLQFAVCISNAAYPACWSCTRFIESFQTTTQHRVETFAWSMKVAKSTGIPPAGL